MIYTAWAGLSLVIVVIWVFGLRDLLRHRETMETWQVVLWAVLIVIVPLVGIIPYLFWRLSRSELMADAMSVSRDRTPYDR